MKKVITLDGWIHCKPAEQWDVDAIGGLKYDFWYHESMEACGHAMVVPYQIQFELPEKFNPNVKFVEALQAEKKKVQAEFEMRLNEIQNQINNFTAIEYWGAYERT